jgi:hypothetical protein
MNLFHVPLYIKAKTEDDLVKRMIENNVKYKMTFKYFDIRKNGQNWYAWYLGDATGMIRREVVDGVEKNNRGSRVG